MTWKEAKTTRGDEPLVRETFVLGADGTRLYVRQRPVVTSPAVRLDSVPPLEQMNSGADSMVPSLAAAAPTQNQSNLPYAIFSDGLLCDGYIWKYLWDAIAERMPVAHWHYRGHGRSAIPLDPEAIGIEAHADDLNRVRQGLGDPPVVFFGHSMGCQVALESYRQRPDGVQGMVLLCGTYGRVTETFRGSNRLSLMLPKMLDRVLAAPALARAVWSRIPPEMALRVALLVGEIDPKAIRREDMLPYLSHMTHVDFPMFLRMLQSAGEHSAEDILAQVQCPVLVVAGEKDSFTPSFLAEEMASKIPYAELLVVPGGTHVTPLEQRDLVNLRIDKFLRDRVLV